MAEKVMNNDIPNSFIHDNVLFLCILLLDALVQISIDESRHILYTRSEKGTIQVFDLGEDGKGMSRIAAVSENTTVQNAALVAR